MASFVFYAKKSHQITLVAGGLQAAVTRPRRPFSRGFGHTPPPPGHSREATYQNEYAFDHSGVV